MGTLHQGADCAALGQAIIKIASVFVATNDRLVKHLLRDSESLQHQLEQYAQISTDFVTKFAFEDKLTPTALGHAIMVSQRSFSSPSHPNPKQSTTTY